MQRDGAKGEEKAPPASPEGAARRAFRFMDLGRQREVFLARTSLSVHLSNSLRAKVFFFFLNKSTFLMSFPAISKQNT